MQITSRNCSCNGGANIKRKDFSQSLNRDPQFSVKWTWKCCSTIKRAGGLKFSVDVKTSSRRKKNRKKPRLVTYLRVHWLDYFSVQQYAPSIPGNLSPTKTVLTIDLPIPTFPNSVVVSTAFSAAPV